MLIVNLLRPGFYLDSVALMRTSVTLKALAGIKEAVLMIGTDTNKQILRDANVLDEKVAAGAGPADLIIAVRGDSDAAINACVEQANLALDSRSSIGGDALQAAPRTLDGANAQLPDANLALISTAGAFATREARTALNNGLNVMLFSDNVSVEDEIALKQSARSQGLIVMGPDCGTAYINGVPLAFANAVSQGSFGVVAASGTGLQEVSVLLTRLGAGISHGLGVGGRDLSDRVGGISTLTALAWLAEDPATSHIILVSKPPGEQTAQQVFAAIEQIDKPVTVCLLGSAVTPSLRSDVQFASTLKQCVETATGHTIADDSSTVQANTPQRSGNIRGLFCGGTLCAEAQIVLRDHGVAVRSNAPVAVNSDAVDAHQLLDLGADEFTVGRPHPMIEPAVRDEPLAVALTDPSVAVVLVDIVLGFGGHLDPAAELLRVLAAHAGDRPAIVAYVCGTDADPQTLSVQRARLHDAGVLLGSTNADAATLALRLCAA